ncbi:MAG: hypothetical protein ACT4O1_05525 [Gemmatimonadota bacterium]
MSDQKKVYAPPTVTDHGKVTEETKGITNISWEVYGEQPPVNDD